MDNGREKHLLELCDERISNGGMTGLCKFIQFYDCPEDERKFLLRLNYIMSIRNGCAYTRTFSLSEYDSLQHIINDTIYLANNLPDLDSRAYLRSKLDEYFFKIHDEEL